MLSRSMLKAGNARGTRETALSVMEPTTPDTYSASGALLRVIPVCGEALSAYAERACSARLAEGPFGMVQQTQESVKKRWCEGSGRAGKQAELKGWLREHCRHYFLENGVTAMHHLVSNTRVVADVASDTKHDTGCGLVSWVPSVMEQPTLACSQEAQSKEMPRRRAMQEARPRRHSIRPHSRATTQEGKLYAA